MQIKIEDGKLTATCEIEIGEGSVVTFPHPEFRDFTYKGLAVSFKYGMALIQNPTNKTITLRSKSNEQSDPPL